jgi:hypothetical protein
MAYYAAAEQVTRLQDTSLGRGSTVQRASRSGLVPKGPRSTHAVDEDLGAVVCRNVDLRDLTRVDVAWAALNLYSKCQACAAAVPVSDED